MIRIGKRVEVLCGGRGGRFPHFIGLLLLLMLRLRRRRCVCVLRVLCVLMRVHRGRGRL